MTDPPPRQSAAPTGVIVESPQISPDGRFWWNGWQWMPLAQPVGVAGRPVVVAARPPIMYLLAGAAVPGLGSMLTGRRLRGAAVLATVVIVWIVAIAAVVVAAPFPHCTSVTEDALHTVTTCAYPESMYTPWVLALPFAALTSVSAWLFGMIDAYRGAREWNREHGITT